MFEEMTTFASDFGGQTLVTDLVHELSSGLEIPFLLSGSPCPDFEKKEKCNELLFDREKCDFKYDYVFYEKDENNLWMDQDPVYNCNAVKRKVDIVCEADDLQTYLGKGEVFTTDSKTDSSGHGSGSDTSSTEMWSVKSERNVSPVTPPEERISPDNVIFFSNNELQFIPISQEGFRKTKQTLNSSNGRMIRIQPKPNAASLNYTSGKSFVEQPNICNVIKDGKQSSLGMRNGLNGMVKDVKNTIMCRKDSEILQAKRKQERMIRNRESAYLSRKRKKEYVAGLEKQVQELVNENSQLRQENHSLKQRLMKYENAASLEASKKSRNVFIDSPKRTTTLFALILTICLNIGPLSNFLNHKTGGEIGENSLQNDEVPFHVQNARHTRSLLWTDPELEDLKSFANFSKTSCPVNQTESIRLESELRRWIRGEDDFSRPTKRNISSNIEYFFKAEKIAKSQSKSKRKNRVRKIYSPSNIEVDVFRMKPHFFNFDTFFEAINRRDDTFYLVSFSADHLLLPALAHNKTSRPKMSLMLPAFLSNATTSESSDQVEMMQIDCEVTNTQLLSVNENDIPSHMRPYSNSTAKQKSSSTEEAEEFSDFLYDSINEKNGSYESITNSMKKNISLSRINNFVKGRIMQDIGKDKRGKSFIPVGDHLHEVVKGKNSKLKANYADEGYLARVKRGRRSSDDGEDGGQFIDDGGKGFLQTLMGPPILSETKNFDYNKKIYGKNYKTALKVLFP